MENPDHYLAFRNLGTSRLRVTSPEGPFHKNNIDAPGAFASCLIARALLFDSEVLHHHTYCYFPDKKAWDAFVAAQDYNQEDEASVKRFFNDACYGTPQAQRGKAMEHVESYFNNDEKRWKAFLETHGGGPVPFEECFWWLMGKVERVPYPDGRRRFSTIPHPWLVGKLTAYLLTADLVYAGKVEPPSMETMGQVIHYNQLGSAAGLHKAGLIGDPKSASQPEVIAAFKCVYEFLDRTVAEEDKRLIGFDEIMVEHLLCKFSRTESLRGVKQTRKGKGKGRGKGI
ncbi:hypothetical protein K466DRAFT_604963 [Polyporus arcularius HHB13444]|uniref:Uncharacterized protein n=1 Tax=Polyporus arcularius HHB13444 TaxID=1314778 RepID=A0A5C3NV27_9APHY|nr:hypothetical protein K466DRAFT_604963 [Polyporus arcularius HHB13444]